MPEEPFFLEMEHVKAIHRRSLEKHGGKERIGDPGADSNLP